MSFTKMSEETPIQEERRHVDVGPYHRSLLKRIFVPGNRFGTDPSYERNWGARSYHNAGNPDLAVDRIGETRRKLGTIDGPTIENWEDPVLIEKQRQAQVLAEAIKRNEFFYGDQFTPIPDQALEQEIRRRLRVRKTDRIGVRPASIGKSDLRCFLITVENRERMGTLFFQDEILDKKPSIYDEIAGLCEKAIREGYIVLFTDEKRKREDPLPQIDRK